MRMGRPRVGVVAYQGAVPEHLRALEAAGAEAVPVRWPRDLEGLVGLIIPGGESTTIGDAMKTWGLLDAVREWAQAGGAIYGTCAGAILLATEIRGGKPEQPRLGLIPMAVQRNGFGRQIESCEADLEFKGIGPGPFHTVFIRAPYFEDLGPGVEPLAELDGKVVAVRYGRFLATAFHPELTDDRRIHRFFLDLATGGTPEPAREVPASDA